MRSDAVAASLYDAVAELCAAVCCHWQPAPARCRQPLCSAAATSCCRLLCAAAALCRRGERTLLLGARDRGLGLVVAAVVHADGEALLSDVERQVLGGGRVWVEARERARVPRQSGALQRRREAPAGAQLGRSLRRAWAGACHKCAGCWAAVAGGGAQPRRVAAAAAGGRAQRAGGRRFAPAPSPPGPRGRSGR